MSGTVITAHRFLNALIPEGLINCRAIDYTKQKPTINDFFPAGDHTSIQQFIQQHGDVEIYFGVVSRWIRDGSTKGCGNAFAIFADIDFKESSEAEARSRLAAFPLKPSIVVWSGGGLHVYWLLQAPYDLRNGSAAQFKSVLRRTGIALKADVVCSEPAHILRIPGTLNHKYPDARTVTVEVWELSRQYTLDDFDFLPPEPEPKPTRNGHVASSSTVLYLNDDEIVTKIRKAENSAKFSRLFDRGDITGYPSQSEADSALICMFAFYTQDESQLDRLFQMSALCREKWTRREDYRRRTIQRAVDRTTERYDPSRNGGRTWNSVVSQVDVDAPLVDDSERILDTDEAGDQPRPTKYSDDALGDLFSTQHEHDFLYVASWGWLRWTGQRWQRVPGKPAMDWHARWPPPR
jgi:hypothetical protein